MAVLYRIVPEESQVWFAIDEILRGQPERVVGTTDQVSGDFIVNFPDPDTSQLGTVRINMRTLRTPDQRRDDAIRSRILESANDKYEFAIFEPAQLVGLPDSVEIDQPASFQIVGTLTIRDITSEVTFNADVRLTAPSRLVGTAIATIQRGAYDLRIPQVPFVGSVSEESPSALTSSRPQSATRLWPGPPKACAPLGTQLHLIDKIRPSP